MGGIYDDLNQLQNKSHYHATLIYIHSVKPYDGFLIYVQGDYRNATLTSVSPIWGFLMRFCKQPLSVLVSSRFVDLRSMSSISVELMRKINQLRDNKCTELHLQGNREHIFIFLFTTKVMYTLMYFSLRQKMIPVQTSV